MGNRVAYTEYAIEVNDKNDRFVKQLDVRDSYEAAEKFVDNFDGVLEDGEYLNIIFINYDENGDEIGFGTVC